MVGMGALVTKDVAPYSLVIGAPAHHAGFVCRCGEPLLRGDPAGAADTALTCTHCDRTYALRAGRLNLAEMARA